MRLKWFRFNNQIVAIAAENSSVGTVRFVSVIDITYVDHLSNYIDGWLRYGHNDPKSHPHLLCNYLEKLNGNKKRVAYQKTEQNVFIYEESIVYWLVQFESNYNNKEDLLFLIKTIDLLKF